MEEGGTLAINSNIIHGNTVSGGDLNGLPPHGAALWLETKEANLSVTANSIRGILATPLSIFTATKDSALHVTAPFP